MNTRIAVVLGCLSIVSASARDAADIQKEYRQVKAARADKWYERDWDLAAEWAVSYLNAHPQATPDAATFDGLGKWMTSLDPDPVDGQKPDCGPDGSTEDFDIHLEQLDSHTFVIATGYLESECKAGVLDAQFGTFFVIAQSNAEYKVAWRPAGWSNLWVTNVNRLPPTAGGHPRFWVEGQHSQAAGVTMGGQLSIWEWDGTRALQLLVRDYLWVADEQTPPIQFDGHLIRVHTKAIMHYLFVTEPEWESEGEWTVRVNPQGVQDLGVRKLHPELDLIDELYYRIANRQPAADLASPNVIAELSKGACMGKDCLSELFDWKLEGSKLCLADGVTNRRVFTLSHASGKLFVTGVQNAPIRRPANPAPMSWQEDRSPEPAHQVQQVEPFVGQDGIRMASCGGLVIRLVIRPAALTTNHSP